MRVTIGIPFLNPGAAFEKAIRSVFAQTVVDWELVLVDDGSSDGSVDRARAISDPRVRVVSDGANRGLCARLAEIAELARCDRLCRMDADDVMHPERLERQLAWLDAHPDVDVLGARAVGIDDLDRPTCLLGQPFDPADAIRTAFVRSLFVHPSVIGRRAWFRANPYDPGFVRAEDHELWLRAAATSRYGFLDACVVYYRQPDALNLGAYVATCRTDRKIFRRYARAAGPWRTAAMLARSWAFEAAHRAACAAGATGPLMRLRGPPVGSDAAAEHAASIARAVAADVPGWGPPPTAAAPAQAARAR